LIKHHAEYRAIFSVMSHALFEVTEVSYLQFYMICHVICSRSWTKKKQTVVAAAAALAQTLTTTMMMTVCHGYLQSRTSLLCLFVHRLAVVSLPQKHVLTVFLCRLLVLLMLNRQWPMSVACGCTVCVKHRTTKQSALPSLPCY